ncbi:kin of IRRE-like protein 2 [Physella acuta]|uniref:kin of IRRE-like protein 2 n=1 Tax=Physella acuta TaxID=109671 RepID=UPI0027DD372E|nr:kin of IRRE-like protein 2 [Physella acuta]XP_059172263.1 kin of IRRE-like protein 2 [Physella acuta]XP_059172272.1 kin of IRRE-like protein 2 [Physella acuta]XP_059172280.1 kin of IRRE-like protein 2 [Physella acuta]XP_059172289.1 kin of IRRE-like protein 2 [Physella acuta]
MMMRIVLMMSLTILTASLDTSDYQDEEQPSFLPRPTNVSFNRGETATLVCGIHNIGTRTVIWRRASDPNPLTIGGEVYVGATRYSAQSNPQENEWKLLIHDVRPSDAGVYECQISSRKKLIHHVLLRVDVLGKSRSENKISKDPKNAVQPTGIFMSGSKFVEKGDIIHLICNSSGIDSSPDSLDWFKDGIKISPDGVRQIKMDKFYVPSTRTLVSVLDIEHSQMDDAGTYVCRSSNLSITSIRVHVLNAGSSNVRRGTWATDKANVGPHQQHNSAIQMLDQYNTLIFGILLYLVLRTFESLNLV